MITTDSRIQGIQQWVYLTAVLSKSWLMVQNVDLQFSYPLLPVQCKKALQPKTLRLARLDGRHDRGKALKCCSSPIIQNAPPFCLVSSESPIHAFLQFSETYRGSTKSLCHAMRM